MSAAESFAVEGMSVSVEETAEALAYTFKPQAYGAQPLLPVTFVLVLVLYPLALLAFVVYAHSKVANRPEWEDVLTGVLAGQLLVWLVTGMGECYRMFRGSYRPYGTVLKFTRTHLWHAGRRVCELNQVRELRLFVHPTTDAPDRLEACLSLVIGEESHTHGLFGGFDAPALRALAEHIHRRLVAFRFNQGMMAPIEPLSVVETTEDDAHKRMHTRPARGSFGAGIARLIFQNRLTGLAWCAAMLAGLFASARMIVAAGFGAPFLLPYCLLGLIHFYLIAYHLGTRVEPTKPPEAT